MYPIGLDETDGHAQKTTEMSSIEKAGASVKTADALTKVLVYYICAYRSL